MTDTMKILNNLISILLMCLLSLTCFSQKGPAGVGNSTNNVIWLNAEVVTFGISPNISIWPDQSGNGNDFSQGTVLRQPRRINYPNFTTVRFRSDWLTSGAISAMNSNMISEYFVFEGSGANHTGVILDAAYTVSNQFLRTERSNGNIKSLVLDNALGTKKNLTTISSSFQIASSIWDGAGAETFTSYKDGTSYGTKTGADGNPTGNSDNSIGATISGAKKLQNDIAEVIVYDIVLNSAQRNLIDNYLSSKYGIAVATDLYAYDSGHENQVFGIGEEADGNNLTGQGAGIVEFSIASLANGEYVMAGHDDIDLSLVTNDVPAIIAGGSRATRTWRADLTGAPGNVDVVFDISSLSLPAGSYYVIVDADGTFSTGATTYGPFVDVGGLVTATGVTLADGDYFTVASGVSVGIVSIQTGDWDDVATWSCGCVPASGDDATVTVGHTVTVDAPASINDITIDGTINSILTSTFDVHGDYTVGATGIVTHKKVQFKGSAVQSIINNSATSVNLRTVVINNTSDVQLNGGSFEVTNSLKVDAGQLQNISSTFTFVSTSTATAVILEGSGNGFSGRFVLERFISTRPAGWGDFSSPVAGLTLGQWDSDETGEIAEMVLVGFTAQGGLDSSGVSGQAAGFESVIDWNEATQAYDSIVDTNYVMPVGKSVEIYMRDVTDWTAKTIDSRGIPNFGSIPVAVVNDWNLVGNPYQNWVKWTNLTKPTLNSTYYIWNTQSASYDAKTTGTIPPHQGFWVESVGAGTLTFTESAKTNSGSSTFWKNGEPVNDDPEPFEFVEAILKIKSNDYYNSHSLKLRMNNMAIEELDYFDASFKESRDESTPSITSFSSNSNKQLAINSFNYKDEIIIPIAVTVGLSGEHIIEPINFDAFENDFEFIDLKDNKTGKVYNLKNMNKGVITFDIKKRENAERFTLRLSNLMAESITEATNEVAIYRNLNNTIIEFEKTDLNYEVSIYNSVGQKVMETVNSGNEEKMIISNNKLPKGINIITVKSLEDVTIKKIYY